MQKSSYKFVEVMIEQCHEAHELIEAACEKSGYLEEVVAELMFAIVPIRVELSATPKRTHRLRMRFDEHSGMRKIMQNIRSYMQEIEIALQAIETATFTTQVDAFDYYAIDTISSERGNILHPFMVPRNAAHMKAFSYIPRTIRRQVPEVLIDWIPEFSSDWDPDPNVDFSAERSEHQE